MLKILLFLNLLFVIHLSGGQRALASDLKRTVLTGINFCCYTEVERLTEKLQAMEGAVGLKADIQNGVLSVDHLPLLRSETIADLIRKTGFPVRSSETSDIGAGEAHSFEKSRFSSWGCAGRRCAGSGYCSASNTSWKILMRRIFGKSDD